MVKQRAWLSQHPLIVVVVIYGLFALLVTVPILSAEKMIGDHHAGSLSLWATWFPSHALNYNYDLVYNQYSFYPLYTHWLGVLSLPTSLFYSVLQPLLGQVLAYNLLYPLYLTLTATCGYMFFRQHSPDPVGLPIIAGGVLAFNPVTYQLAQQGDLALLAWFGLVLWLLLWERFVLHPTFKRILGVAVGLYLVVLLSVQYWNLILTLLLPYAIWRWLVHRSHKTQAERDQMLENVLVGVLLFALLFLIFPASAWLWSTYYLRYEPLEIWQGVVQLSGAGWSLFAYGGLAALVIALLMPWETSPHRRWWAGIFALNVLLYFRPQLAPLTVIGDVFAVPHNPDLTRSAIFLIPVILSVTVLVMQGLGVILRWSDYNPALPHAAYVMLGGLMMWSSGWWQGLPTSDVPPIAYYEVLAQEPENYLVVDFPPSGDNLARQTLWRRGQPWEAYPMFNLENWAGEYMTYAPFHHKRLVGGYIPQITGEKLALYQTSPLLRLLTFNPDNANRPQFVIDLRREVVRWRAGYVVIHQGRVPPEFEEALRGWMRWTDTFCPVHQEGTAEFWRARWHPVGCPAYQVRVGAAEGELAIGAGWYGAEYWDRPVRWAGDGLNAEVTLWVTNPATDYTLTIRAATPADIPLQTVTVVANGETVGEIEFTPEASDQTVTIPRLTIAEGGLLVVELQHGESVKVDGRDLTAVYETFELQPIQP